MSSFLYPLSPTKTHTYTYSVHIHTYITNDIHLPYTHTSHRFPEHVTTSHAYTTSRDPPRPPVLARPTPRALPRRRRAGDTPRVTTRHARDGRGGVGTTDRPVTTLDRPPLDVDHRRPRSSRPHSETRDEDDDEEDLDGEEDGDAGEEEDGVAPEARGEKTGEKGAGEEGERWRPARRSGRGACVKKRVERRARVRASSIGSTDENARDSTQIAFPFGDRPAWLDGSLPGDRGFDPFELGKKSEYLQFSPDALDGSAAKNPSGNVIGKVKATDNKPKARTLAVRVHAFFLRLVRVRCRIVHRSRGSRLSSSSIGYRSRRDRAKIWF